GKWMAEFKYMYMNMEGMRHGTQSLSAAQVFAQSGVPVVPIDMNMDMYMGHVMYGLTDDITLYTMFMWTELSMDHIVNPALTTRFRAENSDFDDMRVGALLRLCECDNSLWIGHLGLSLPTGDIGQRIGPGVPPAGQVFPYPMRTGEGHVSAIPGLTYKRWNDCGSMGAQVMSVIPLHENYRQYKEGVEVRVNWWVARLVHDNLSVSFRAEGYWRDNIDGRDPQANAPVTTNRVDYQGRTNVNLYYGVNRTLCGGNRLALEVGHPVFQDVRGYQLEQDFFLFTSWSKGF
ncbi:MAG: hypothetical protein KDA41_04235, partial [Planctomycetales bacterium]|nr:hypothetical protein [Planctomycetales bacterium]